MLDVGPRHVERDGELRARRCAADLRPQLALEPLKAPQAGVGAAGRRTSRDFSATARTTYWRIQ